MREREKKNLKTKTEEEITKSQLLNEKKKIVENVEEPL